jgi:hypothetical protein
LLPDAPSKSVNVTPDDLEDVVNTPYGNPYSNNQSREVANGLRLVHKDVSEINCKSHQKSFDQQCTHAVYQVTREVSESSRLDCLK